MRIVTAFRTSGLAWNSLVGELLSSPITTHATAKTSGPTTTPRTEVIAVARRDHLCSAIDSRLGLADICQLDATLDRRRKVTPISQIVAGLPSDAKVTDVFCDMNGEPYRADEFGFATLRTKEHFVAASDFVAPADCWGDVSAASVPLGLMLSTIAARKSYAHGPYAFLWASSESGERGAALLEQAPLAAQTS